MKLPLAAVALLFCLFALCGSVNAQKLPKGITSYHDSFRDETTVKMEPARMDRRVTSGQFWAYYDYKGKTQPAITEITLFFFFGSREWLLQRSDHQVRLKINGSEIIDLGAGGYTSKVGTDRSQYLTQELVSVQISIADAVRASNATSFSAQVGTLVVELPPKVIATFKSLVALAQTGN